MNIRQLRCFIQVAEMRSITRAASVLHVAQSALSRQMKLLESEIGDDLFERTERGVSLTQVGEQLLHRAGPLVREFETLRADVTRREASLSGPIRLGVPPSLCEHVIIPALATFCAQHPAVSISLFEGTTLDLRERMKRGAFDLAIVSSLENSPSARMHPLVSEAVVIYSTVTALSMATPVSVKQIAQRPFVLPARPNIIRLQLEELMARQGLPPKVALEANALTVLRGFVMAGTCDGVLPYSAVSGMVASGAVRAAPIKGAKVSWQVMATSSRDLPRQADALRDHLIAHVHALVRARQWPSARHG